MMRAILATGLATAMLILPAGAFAQQAAPGDGIETYSDTLPKHGPTAAKLVALKTSPKKGHNGKSRKGGKSHGGKTKVKAAG